MKLFVLEENIMGNTSLKTNFDFEQELSKCKTLDDVTGKDGMIQRMIKVALESMLEREMNSFIGSEKHERSFESNKNYRNGSYPKTMRKLLKTQLLVLDDFGLAPLSDPERRDFLEVIEDRHGASSTIVTSQLPVETWHEHIGNPTIADAILDRLIHNAHRINLKGGSMRKKLKLDSA